MWGKLLPFCRSRILVIFVTYIMAAIARLGEVDVAIPNLSLIQVPPLLSSFLPLLTITAVIIPY
jgi:hypothetical protein